MKKIINLLGILIVFPVVFSCATTESTTIEGTSTEVSNISDLSPAEYPAQSVSEVLNEALNSASEIIIDRLPVNSAVALFNLSSADTELTDFVIKELSDKFKTSGNLRIVGSNDGVQYAVNCSISGNDVLRRLRLKTWNVYTGETVASIVCPVDDTGKRFIMYLNSCGVSPDIEAIEMHTITDNGITVDFSSRISGESDSIRQTLTYYDVYIESTMDYFNFIFSDYENQYLKQRSFSCQMVNIMSSDSRNVDNWSSREIFDYYDFEASLMKFLGDQDVSAQNMSSIAKIFGQILN